VRAAMISSIACPKVFFSVMCNILS
jgi:hypothetical protein